ncbi:MAG: PAS domain S-box protein, partial [Acidobacteriaceae bacterium]|nr:PAS domain S-box protein [Acidobacteriaceae bacterium]
MGAVWGVMGKGSSVLSSQPSLVALQSPEVFRTLVDTVADYAIFLLDPAGYIGSWNTGAERMKGYTREEVVGKHFSIFYIPSDLAADKPAHELRIAGEVGRYEDEGWRVRKDGTR